MSKAMKFRRYGDPIPQSDLAGCPDCDWRGEIEECDVLGASDDGVFCPECSMEFCIATGGEINVDDVDDDDTEQQGELFV